MRVATKFCLTLTPLLLLAACIYGGTWYPGAGPGIEIVSTERRNDTARVKVGPLVLSVWGDYSSDGHSGFEVVIENHQFSRHRILVPEIVLELEGQSYTVTTFDRLDDSAKGFDNREALQSRNGQISQQIYPGKSHLRFGFWPLPINMNSQMSATLTLPLNVDGEVHSLSLEFISDS